MKDKKELYKDKFDFSMQIELGSLINGMIDAFNGCDWRHFILLNNCLISELADSLSSEDDYRIESVQDHLRVLLETIGDCKEVLENKLKQTL